jgi:hypothetical protein
MTNGESLAKTIQRIIHSLITFLVWIVFFHFTSCNTFVFGVQASQRSPKTPSKTILFLNNGPAIATSRFLQLPHNGPAHFKQTFVPIIISSTGIQADNDCHSSLNDVTSPQALSATTATTTGTMTQVHAIATMTQVHAIATATTKAKLLKLDECFLHPEKTGANNSTIKSESLLLHAQIGSAITTALNAQNLLLLSVQDNSAIMMATHTIYSLQLIVEYFSTGAKQVVPATIRNNSFKLIVALASEGAIFTPQIFQDTSYLYKLNHEGATSFQTSKLIVMYSKTSLCFCKDCGLFCEGEREQQRQLNKHNGLVGLSLIGYSGLAILTGFVALIGLIDFISLDVLIGLVGFIGCNGLTGLIGLIGLITGLVGLVGLIDCIVHIRPNSCQL